MADTPSGHNGPFIEIKVPQKKGRQEGVGHSLSFSATPLGNLLLGFMSLFGSCLKHPLRQPHRNGTFSSRIAYRISIACIPTALWGGGGVEQVLGVTRIMQSQRNRVTWCTEQWQDGNKEAFPFVS